MPTTLTQVVSGGQTGVDRAGLDAAIFHNIPHGGWCPMGRRCENGRIPDRYQLQETESRNYAVRTRQNVIDSDGTLILFENSMSRGTGLTAKFARQFDRPLLAIDIVDLPDWTDENFQQQVQQANQWLERHDIAVLNIAGPRESTSIGIGDHARTFLLRVFESQVVAGG